MRFSRARDLLKLQNIMWLFAQIKGKQRADREPLYTSLFILARRGHDNAIKANHKKY